MWCACKAHWNIRCAASLGAAPNIEEVVTKWAGEIKVALRWESLKFHSQVLLDFHGAPLFFLREGTVPKRHINWRQFHLDAIPDTAADPKRQRHDERMHCKATVAEQLKGLATTYLREGWHTFFFDGSAKQHPKCGYVGWYGCCFLGRAPLEEDERQTNNKAELKAAIAAVLKVTQ